MQELKEKIQKLFNRNLVLSNQIRVEVYSKLPTLNEDQLKRILKILEHVDEQQTEAIEKILEKDPYFFNKLEHIILETMEEEFQKIEAKEHEKADKWLEWEVSHIQMKKISIKEPNHRIHN